MKYKYSTNARLFTVTCCNRIISGLFGTLTSVFAAYYMGDIKMTPQILGIYFSMSGVMTAILATLPGRIIDKIGSKVGLVSITIGEIIAFLVFPLATNVPLLFLASCLHTFITSFVTPCQTQILRVQKIKEPAKYLRVNSLGGTLAGVVTSFSAARLVEYLGMSWRQATFVFFGVACIFAVVSIVIMTTIHIDWSGVTVTKKKDAAAVAAAKNYKYTPAERKCVISFSLLYISYIGVSAAISMWQPALLMQKGFTGVEASWPNTVGTIINLVAFALMPTLMAKTFKTFKLTPIAVALLAVVVFGSTAVDSIIVICCARGLLAFVMAFLALHLNGDMALVAPRQASGRFSSTALAWANLGGVIAVGSMGYLPKEGGALYLLMAYVVIGVIGSVMLIKPAEEIRALREAEEAEEAEETAAPAEAEAKA